MSDNLTQHLHGKVITRVEIVDDFETFLVFHFSDATSLWVMYDYIYRYDLRSDHETKVIAGSNGNAIPSRNDSSSGLRG